MYLYRRIVEAKLFIDQHFAEKIDLDNIASQASFSKYHFLRLFKGAYGKSPHQYLTQVRIAHARQLLSNGVSIAETCEASGFESVPSFTQLFKKYVGETPRAFWEREKERQQVTEVTPFHFVPSCFADSYGWRK